MSHRATTKQEPDERTLWLVGEPRTTREVEEALDAIPADSVTARTAGALRAPGPRRTIGEERANFEQTVAEENAGLAER